MNAPLVSVVVPVYNGSRYLQEALDSALAQSYRPLEFIVVDDGSTDSSPAIIRSYSSRVRSIRQDNRGVAGARNAGIRAARGEWIAFLDQDDWWLPEKIAKQIGVASEDEAIGLVHTEVKHYHNASGEYVRRFNPNRSDLLTGYCYERLLLGNGIFNSSVMARHAVLDQAGGFNEEMLGNTAQDYDLWLRVAKRSKLSYVPEQLAVYRLHPAQGMWRVQACLAAELAVLRQFVGDFQLASDKMKDRLTKLLDELGVAFLDDGKFRMARQCFAHAVGIRPSRRLVSLYLATYLPSFLVHWLRGAKTFAARAFARQRTSNIPRWTEPRLHVNGGHAVENSTSSTFIE